MKDSNIYRKEALDYHQQPPTSAEPLMLSAAWSRWIARLLVCAGACAVLLTTLVSIDRYAEGPALIQAADRIAITATTGGLVEEVAANPGDAVHAGDVLIFFRATEDKAQFGAVDLELRSAMARMLADPRDQAARLLITNLRTERDLLIARLDDRVAKAPHDGIVGDIRVRPGQVVSPGDELASMALESQSFTVLALIPGAQRPDLTSGQRLRLELTGYPYVYHDLPIEHVDQEVVGAIEAKRILGPGFDSLPITQPVVLVRARLDRPTFQSDGREYRFYDGMHGVARIRLRAERLLSLIIPGLKASEKVQ